MGFFATLKADLQRVYPKAKGVKALLYFVQAVVCRGGYLAVLLYRIRHALVQFGVIGGILEKALGFFARPLTASDIAAEAVFGPGLFIAHSTGVVVGKDVVAGENCSIYQNVTLGHRGEYYPTLANNVTVYSGAVVAGAVKIGDNARIGANALVIEDVPANATAAGNPAQIMIKKPKTLKK